MQFFADFYRFAAIQPRLTNVCVFAKKFPALTSQSCCEVSRPRAVGEYEYPLLHCGYLNCIALTQSDSIFFTHDKNINKLERENNQRAKKVVSDSPGLVDFAIGQVNSVFNLPDWQVMFFEEF